MDNPFNTNHSPIRTGSDIGYVVGSFTNEGKPIKEGTFTSSEGEVLKLAKAYDSHASRVAEFNPDTVTTKTKRKKKGRPKSTVTEAVIQKNVEDRPFQFFDFSESDEQGEIARPPTGISAPVKSKRVKFSNKFGDIKVAVESVLNCSMAIGLIFSSEEDLVFTPKAGEALQLTVDDITHNVYYPNVLFSLPGGSKKLMILITTDELLNTDLDEPEEKLEDEHDTTFDGEGY